MTHDSSESSPKEKRDLHIKRRRAAEAMVNHIVLRDADTLHAPNFDPESHEGWLRSQVFRLQHEALELDPDGEFDTPTPPSLGETMLNPQLSALAQPGRPITPERLTEIDPALRRVATRMDDEGIGWPTDDSVFHDVLPEDFDDTAFGWKLVERGRAYNNFPAIISTVPSRPNEGEEFVTYIHRTTLFQYASKPYLARAYALQPEFMGALQTRMAEISSPTAWQESLFHAVSEDHPDPEDQILLRASRLAYQLLINLMRKDDLQTQSRILATSLQNEITDPITELWT